CFKTVVVAFCICLKSLDSFWIRAELVGPSEFFQALPGGGELPAARRRHSNRERTDRERVAMSNWFVTGVSSGIGRAIAGKALERGDKVVGTLRKADEVAAFEALAPGRAHAVLIDVDRVQDAPGVVEKTIK